MSFTQHRRRPSAEENCARPDLKAPLMDRQFCQQRSDKGRNVRAARRVLVKAAVRTDAVAEGDVDVEVLDQFWILDCG